MNELIQIRLRKQGDSVIVRIKSRLRERRWVVPNVSSSPNGFCLFVQREVAREIVELYSDLLPKNLDSVKLLIHYFKQELLKYQPLMGVAKLSKSCERAVLIHMPEPEAAEYRTLSQPAMDVMVWCRMIVEPKMEIAV